MARQCPSRVCLHVLCNVYRRLSSCRWRKVVSGSKRVRTVDYTKRYTGWPVTCSVGLKDCLKTIARLCFLRTLALSKFFAMNSAQRDTAGEWFSLGSHIVTPWVTQRMCWQVWRRRAFMGPRNTRRMAAVADGSRRTGSAVLRQPLKNCRQTEGQCNLRWLGERAQTPRTRPAENDSSIDTVYDRLSLGDGLSGTGLGWAGLLRVALHAAKRLLKNGRPLL